MPAFEIDLSPLQAFIAQTQAHRRTDLLPVLHAAQDLYGYIPEPAAAAIGRALGVPLADVHGVIDFYALFYRHPVARKVIHVCNDPACALAGADSIYKVMKQQVAVSLLGESITVEQAPCLGLCEHAPALLSGGRAITRADTHTWEEMVTGQVPRPHNPVYREVSLLTTNCGNGKTTSLPEYRAGGGYQGLAQALNLTPAQVIETVKAAGLVGRGGAAFPTGAKWESAANAPGSPKYLVCNADEAEPGTFKDRVLMEDDPHRLLEGILIAAYAIGAQKGYLYVRGEYQYAAQVLVGALEEARGAGWLGERILGTDFSFDVELRRGAGAYICGEETALFESIEGKRGFPRIKPPFPTTHGLFGQPTVINNVETLVNVPYIIQAGAQGYRAIGTEKSPGPKLFCVSGDVVRPGLYEVPFGVSIRHLLYELAGGVRSGHTLQAALFGGAAGAFATPDTLDVRLSFEDLRAAGLPLGSGVITVFDETRDLRDVLLRLARFFAEESCGKCYPCQIGTQRQYEIIQRAAAGQALPGDIERLQDVGWTMTDASLCGLGQTAASAVLSALKLWPGLFQESAEEHQ